MRPVRVLVVDDSATMRSLISSALCRDPSVDVIGEACDPFEAREAIKALNPDVVTLDVEMPNMSGIDFLEKIMRLRPTPVIMISNLTTRGTATTIKALEIGAFDCVAKPVSGDAHAFDDLAEKVIAAASAPLRSLSSRPSRSAATAVSMDDYKSDGRVVAIGASTGGVEALIAVVSQFPANCPPTLIAQHMPGGFTKSFADRLNRLSAPHVAEAVDGAQLAPGHVYLAPGGVAHLEVARSGTLRCRLKASDLVNGHRPSVDVLFQSVARTLGPRAVGVILTGMGRDGAEGLLAMRRAGANTIGQDEASCLVYGMPKAAYEIGAVEKRLSLQKIASEILGLTSAKAEGEVSCHSRQP